MAVPSRYMMIWSGPRLPYPAALAIAAALNADPDADVELHLLGTPPASLELHRLLSHPRFSVHHIDIDRLLSVEVRELFERIPADAHAAKSNVLRVALLHQRGGVYLDLDTFLLRPLPPLAPESFVGLERVWIHDRIRVEGQLRPTQWLGTAAWGLSWAAKRLDTKVLRGRARLAKRLDAVDQRLHTEQLNNAVIGAAAGSDLTAAMLERALQCDPEIRYALGPALLHDTVAADPTLASVLPREFFYAVPPGESHRFFDDRTLHLPPEAALVHYVNSNHQALLSTIECGDARFARSELFWRLAAHAERELMSISRPREAV